MAKIIGICGNHNNYGEFVQTARKEYRVHDFGNDVNENWDVDIKDCEILYIVGKYYEISEDTWGLIAFAKIYGIETVSVHGIRSIDISRRTVQFLRELANGLEEVIESQTRLEHVAIMLAKSIK